MSDRRNENIILFYLGFCSISPAVDMRPTISTTEAGKFELHSDLTIQYNDLLWGTDQIAVVRCPL